MSFEFGGGDVGTTMSVELCSHSISAGFETSDVEQNPAMSVLFTGLNFGTLFLW